jgi:hypothetical protein
MAGVGNPHESGKCKRGEKKSMLQEKATKDDTKDSSISILPV